MAKAKQKSLAPLRVIEKFQNLKAGRTNFETVWQECMDYCNPRKNDVQTINAPGEKKYVNLLDSTAMTNAELLAGALHGMLTNPSGYFFNLTTGNPMLDRKDSVRMWIQETVRVIHDALNNSNFQTEVHEVYLDLVSCGTAAMITEEDSDTIVRFSTKPLREIFADENSKGFIDSVYRSFEMSARDMVDEFGIDEVPEKVKKCYEDGKTEKFEVIHAVYPKKLVKGEKDNSKYNFVSQYVFVKDKTNISVSGFREFPYVVPRWTKVSGETYGRGPGEKALPSAKTLNKMRETVLRGAQKVVDPPLQAPDDGFVTQLNTKPGGISYYRAGSQDRIQTIFNDARIDFGFQAIDQERAQVREAFYADQLKLREGPQMTATEVSERVEQALRFLGPMLGRLQSEFLAPMIERVYAIMDRNNRIPEIPAELEGIELKIQYSSVMAMSQRLSEVQNINRTMQAIAPFAAIDPGVTDNIDGDIAVRYVAGLFNFPQEILRKDESLKALRQQKAEAQQAQMQAMQAQEQADQVNKVVSASAKMQQTKQAAG